MKIKILLLFAMILFMSLSASASSFDISDVRFEKTDNDSNGKLSQLRILFNLTGDLPMAENAKVILERKKGYYAWAEEQVLSINGFDGRKEDISLTADILSGEYQFRIIVSGSYYYTTLYYDKDDNAGLENVEFEKPEDDLLIFSILSASWSDEKDDDDDEYDSSRNLKFQITKSSPPSQEDYIRVQIICRGESANELIYCYNNFDNANEFMPMTVKIENLSQDKYNFGIVLRDQNGNQIASYDNITDDNFSSQLFETYAQDELCSIPYSLGATNLDQSSPRLTWGGYTDIENYKLQIREINGSWGTIRTVSNRYYDVPNVDCGYSYEFKVLSVCDNRDSEWSAVSSPFSSYDCPVDNPSNLSVISKTQTSANLDWSNVSGATSYQLRYRKEGAISWIDIDSYPKESRFTLSGLKCGETYEYSVMAWVDENYSGYTDGDPFTTENCVCDVPTNISVIDDYQKTVKISWTPVSGATSYKIRYQKQGGSLIERDAKYNDHYYTSPLDPGSTYEFSVRTDCSSWAENITFTTAKEVNSCGTPTNLRVSEITQTTAKLTWDAISGANSYWVGCRELGESAWRDASNEGIISNLECGIGYEFTIIARCDSEQSEMAASVEFTTLSCEVETCNLPTNLVISNKTETTARLDWDYDSNVNSYQIKYKKQSEDTWNQEAITTNYFNFVELAENYTYEYQVMANCSSTSYSDWTEIKTFQTNEGLIDVKILEADSLALVALYNSAGGENWINKTNWLTGNVKDWFGVTVADNRVVEIDLNTNKLSGEFPSEIGDLSDLKTLILNDNSLKGSILTLFSQLINLTTLNLDFNDLSGAIPQELGDLTKLTTLSLWGNDLDGEIPAELGKLLNLTFLNLGANGLTGSIPSELGVLSQLQGMALQYNKLSGVVPVELGNLENLVRMDLGFNDLSGEIPKEIGKLTNLKQLSLYYNELSGEIPSELGGLSSLEFLILNFNKLNGSIPAELGNLTGLRWFWLDNNQLSGVVPSHINQLVNLEILRFENNKLSGLTDLSALTKLTKVNVSANFFTFEDLESTKLNLDGKNYYPQDTLSLSSENVRINEGIAFSFADYLVEKNSLISSNSQYSIFKDGQLVYGPANDFALSISSLRLEDEGKYNLEITNSTFPELKLVSDTLKLKVNSRPNKPLLISPEDNEYRISLAPTLTWSCDDIDGDTSFKYSVWFNNGFGMDKIAETTDPSYDFSSSKIKLEHEKTYTWKIIANDGVLDSEASDVWSFSTDVATGIEDLKSNVFQLYPNPVKDYLTVSSSETNTVLIQVLGAGGEVVFSEEWESPFTNRINFSNYSNGLYLLRFIIDGKVVTHKIMLVK